MITVGIYSYFLQYLLLSADTAADHRSLPDYVIQILIPDDPGHLYYSCLDWVAIVLH